MHEPLILLNIGAMVLVSEQCIPLPLPEVEVEVIKFSTTYKKVEVE